MLKGISLNFHEVILVFQHVNDDLLEVGSALEIRPQTCSPSRSRGATSGGLDIFPGCGDTGADPGPGSHGAEKMEQHVKKRCLAHWYLGSWWLPHHVIISA